MTFCRSSWCPMASPHPRLIVWELKCLKWLFSSVIAFRSGLYLGRSLSESYKNSKWLFRRTSWCPMASPHPRLIVWELKCLKLLFSSVIVVTVIHHLGLELFSFRARLFCLVFDCGMGCMSLSLLVKVWVLLKLQSIVFFYKVDCPLFLPFLQLFLFHFSFSRDLRLHGGLRTYRLFAFTHVVFGLVFLGGWFSR